MIYHLFRILVSGNTFNKTINLMRLIYKILCYEGLLGLFRRTKLSVVYLKQKVTKPYDVKRIDITGFLNTEDQNNQSIKASIIFPTKNGGKEFESTMKAYSAQKGIEDVEIIIVDSGSKDETLEVAAKFGANIFHISSDLFNHGLTRNYGEEKSHGKYVVFTVQDAIPLNEYLLQAMVDILERDSSVAAVTCKQFLRNDADLFAKFMNYIQCNSMGLIHNEIRFLNNKEDYHHLSPSDRRRLSQLDNVCCCFRKNIFDLYRFRKMKYAEDLEIGSRLAKDGHKLAFLSSNGVIHSHNRSSVHFLKRSYTDTRLAPRILEYYPRIPILPRKITLKDIFNDMKELYFDLGRLIDLVNWTEDNIQGISRVELFLTRGIKSIQSKSKKIDEEMETFLDEFQHIIRHQNIEGDKNRENVFKSGFILNIERFRKYITTNKVSLELNSSELIISLFKLLGLWFGFYLGSIMNAAERNENELIFQESIDTLLSKGL